LQGLILRSCYGPPPAHGQGMKLRRGGIAIAAARDDEHRDGRALDELRTDAAERDLPRDPKAARPGDDQIHTGRGLLEQACRQVAAENYAVNRDGVRKAAERRVERALADRA
jgi:hypothetical protein